MPTLTREELYALVWAEPTSKIASRYGISDRGLGKLCARKGIPVPPRGWWAKKAAGKRLRQPPLPAIAKGQQIRDLTPEEHERRRQGLDVNPYRTIPAGTLGFYEGVYGVNKSTADSAKRRLEDRLNVFIESLVRRAYQVKAIRAERERREEEHRIAEEKRREEELHERHELAQRERFDTLVKQWRAAERRRQFLAALRESIGEVAEDSPLGEWLRWGERSIEVSDPLTRFREREATITLYYNGYGHEIAEIRTRGFKDEVPPVGYGEKPKAPGVRLSDVPDSDGWGREALELVLPKDAVLPYETTEPGFVPRRFCVPAGVLNALLPQERGS